MKSHLLLLSLLISLLIPLVLPAADAASDLIAQGDAFDARMKTSDALEKYLQADKLRPNNAEILHRIAKQYGESMNDVSTTAEQKEYGVKALDAAQRAVAADEKNALAHVALAVSYGRLAAFLDNKEKIAYSKLVKEHADRALALDDKCELAYHVLGAWNYELSDFGMVMRALVKVAYGGLPETSYAAAERNFLKACELNPKRVGNFVELGRTFLKLDKKLLAKENLQKGLALPSIHRDDEATKARARDLLKKL